MTPEEFLGFKKMGKRHGTATFDQKLFMSVFSNEQDKQQAALAWNDLKNTKIITEKNKLSPVLPMLAGKNVKLACYNGQSTHYFYPHILKGIYVIADHQPYQQQILQQNFPFIKERSERSSIQWCKTSAVKNDKQNERFTPMKLWDVTPYNVAKAYRNTDSENKEYGFTLNYDHIPSSDELNRYKQAKLKLFLQQLQELQNSIQQLQTYLDNQTQQYFAKNHPNVTYTKERRDWIIANQFQLFEYQNEIIKKTNECNGLSNEYYALLNEKSSSWWTIAVPEKLHTQGSTFLKSSKSQQTVEDPAKVFESNIQDYLEFLNARPEEFKLNKEDCLKFLGSARYLYKCGSKKPEVINGIQMTGMTSHLFFKNQNKSSIDKFFNDAITDYVKQKEEPSLKK